MNNFVLFKKDKLNRLELKLSIMENKISNNQNIDYIKLNDSLIKIINTCFEEVGVDKNGCPIGHNGRLFRYDDIVLKISSRFLIDFYNDKLRDNGFDFNGHRGYLINYGSSSSNSKYMDLNMSDFLLSEKNKEILDTFPYTKIYYNNYLVGYIYKYLEGYKPFRYLSKEEVSFIFDMLYRSAIQLLDLYNHNIYHLDMKLDNIMYKDDVKIIDFDTPGKLSKYGKDLDNSLLLYYKYVMEPLMNVMISKKHGENEEVINEYVELVRCNYKYDDKESPVKTLEMIKDKKLI